MSSTRTILFSSFRDFFVFSRLDSRRMVFLEDETPGAEEDYANSSMAWKRNAMDEPAYVCKSETSQGTGWREVGRLVAYLLRGRRRLGRLGRRSRYTKPVYNRGPETRSQRSRFGRSNLILKGNPASDWTHLRGSVCISSTCTPSLRVSGRCLRRRRTRRAFAKRNELLYGELEYMLEEELVSRRRGTRYVGALTGSVVSIVWHFGSDRFVGKVFYK